MFAMQLHTQSDLDLAIKSGLTKFHIEKAYFNGGEDSIICIFAADDEFVEVGKVISAFRHTIKDVLEALQEDLA
jgi:hypothetical protein